VGAIKSIFKLLYKWSIFSKRVTKNNVDCPFIHNATSYIFYDIFFVGQTDIIDFFGVSGNDKRDKITLYSSSSLMVFCGSQQTGVNFDWFFSNGTKVGTANRNVREGHYANGTTVLQIGRFGRVTWCDADTYVCRANQTATGRVQQKTFKVTYYCEFCYMD